MQNHRRSLLAVAAAGLALSGMGLTAPASPASPTAGYGSNVLTLESIQFERALRSMPLAGALEFFNTLGITPGRFRRMSGEGFVKHRRPGERAHRTWRLARASGRR